MTRDGIPIVEPQDVLTREERRANRRRSTRKRPSLAVKSSLEKGFRSILSKMKHHQVPSERLKDDPLEENLNKSLSLAEPEADPTETETEERDDDNEDDVMTSAVLAKAAHPPRRRRRTILRQPSSKENLLSMLQEGLNVPASDQLDLDDYHPNDDEDSDSDEDEDALVFDECQDEALRGLLRSSRDQLNTLLKATTESQRLSPTTPKKTAVDLQLAPEETCKSDRPRRRQSVREKRSSGAVPATSLRSRPRRSSSTVECSTRKEGQDAVETKRVEGKDLDASNRRGSRHTSSRRRGASVRPSQDDGERRSSRRRSSSLVPTTASTATSSVSKRLGRQPSEAEIRPRRRSRSCSRRRRSGRNVVPANHDSIKPTSSSSSESQQRNQKKSRRSTRRESVKEESIAKAAHAVARSSLLHDRRTSSQQNKVVEPLQLVIQPDSDSKETLICSCEPVSFPISA